LKFKKKDVSHEKNKCEVENIFRVPPHGWESIGNEFIANSSFDYLVNFFMPHYPFYAIVYMAIKYGL